MNKFLILIFIVNIMLISNAKSKWDCMCPRDRININYNSEFTNETTHAPYTGDLASYTHPLY